MIERFTARFDRNQRRSMEALLNSAENFIEKPKPRITDKHIKLR